MIDPREIGRGLVELRRERGLSQRELGEFVRVKQQQIARWESSDYRTASLERAGAVAEALGLLEAASMEAVPLAAEAKAAYRPGRQPLDEILLVAGHAAVSEVCARHHIRRLSVFGSATRSGLRRNSDLDLLVEFEPGETPEFEFVDVADELSELFGRAVDLHTPASISPYFRDDVIREAVPLCVR